ncbi:extracellular solute-binding protein [Phycicoccus sp. DTK01]|uniref:sugar ABC transporter substrate-binding protein n=1 Tax=Phycicoccus sp. DTK01 TaxID=2785745 RepID=UPI001A8FEC05|nr:extracellular solute-binding protein [Phycicoccus sp. DTK01]
MRPGAQAAGVAVIGMLVLSACGSGSDSGSGASGGQKTLTVWTYYTAGGQNDALEQQNALWAKSHPDVKIETVQIPFDQLPSKLLATATTQDGPDVVLDNVVVDFPTLASAGVLADLSSYWDGYADKGLFPDSAVWKFDDKVYNVMSYTNLLGLYYNKDLLDAAGVEPPQTMEELTAALEKLAPEHKNSVLAESGAPTVEGAWMFMPMLLGQGKDYCSMTESDLATNLQTVQGWSQGGIIPRETATWDQADAWQAFMSGKYPFGINGNWNLADAKSADFTVGTTRFPAGPQGSHVFPGGEAIGIGAFAKDKDLAWQYVQEAWMSKDASLINFKASGQIPTRSDLADNEAITGDELVQPFVAAAGETGAWPLNKETAAMQTAVGQAFSAVISGQSDPAKAAKDAMDGVSAAREKGGGSCS